MSLLMQALKKAERARQSGLQEEDMPVADMPVSDVPVADMPVEDMPVGDKPVPDVGDGAHDSAYGSAMDSTVPAFAGGLELSLEPLDAQSAQPREQASEAASKRAPVRAEPLPPSASPPIHPAVEATHNPVPPQARHEGVRTRGDAEIPVVDARPAPGPASQATSDRRGPARPERRAVPRDAAPVSGDTAGVDTGRLRLAGLAGILVIIAGTFGYVYWKAVSGPGPGASLPMVPMPPPSATGATSIAGDGGIVVAPAGPPFGPLGAPAAGSDPATSAGAAYGAGAVPATIQAPPEAAPSQATAPPAAAPAPAPAESLQPVPRGRRNAVSTGPTPAQLAAIADPEMRREAQREAEERAMREARQVAAPATTAPPAGAVVADAGQAYAPPGAAGTDVQVARGASPVEINPAVRAGYAAFGSGDLATARQHYATALRQDPNNRDALLGSAVIAARERRDDEAASFYSRLLAANPRDAEAIAGLAGLRPGDGDRAEIRLKGVLRNNQDAPSVHFALGNLYARQGRWQEAQQAYFRAWSAAPGNADYAFNLAVGLDRLNQGRLARDYYGRALALAAGGAAAFDRAAVQRRLQELSGATPPATRAPSAPPAPAAVTEPAPADAQVPAAPAGN